jgi:hypothetical protein
VIVGHGTFDMPDFDYSKMDYGKLDYSKLDYSKLDCTKLDVSQLDPNKLPRVTVRMGHETPSLRFHAKGMTVWRGPDQQTIFMLPGDPGRETMSFKLEDLMPKDGPPDRIDVMDVVLTDPPDHHHDDSDPVIAISGRVNATFFDVLAQFVKLGDSRQAELYHREIEPDLFEPPDEGLGWQRV